MINHNDFLDACLGIGATIDKFRCPKCGRESFCGVRVRDKELCMKCSEEFWLATLPEMVKIEK